jgi:hypothetical protein
LQQNPAVLRVDVGIDPLASIEELSAHWGADHLCPGIERHQAAHVEQAFVRAARRGRRVFRCGMSRNQPIHEDGPEDVLLVLEDAIEQRAREARAPGDILERRLREAEVEEAPPRGEQDLRAARGCLILFRGRCQADNVTIGASFVNTFQ